MQQRRRFSARPEHLGAARRWAVELVAASSDTPHIDLVAVIVRELAQNAFTHAGSCCEMSIGCHPVRIEARDDSPIAPVVRPHDDAALGGWGMQLVAGLSDRWGTRPTATARWSGPRSTPSSTPRWPPGVGSTHPAT